MLGFLIACPLRTPLQVAVHTGPPLSLMLIVPTFTIFMIWLLHKIARSNNFWPTIGTFVIGMFVGIDADSILQILTSLF
ncbi:hypothetical protein FD41_GL001348 [Lentilactobacillus farraginis DSM 18382 = JCM 14108]|uniref:Uncharacterized protein n=1 Tax=Lentilactobacillus farraginis DSM 18382 = JCM 14108 TaxID=1423743 RepID=X0QBX0_9LACO|nr:hypothetical protein FD41_GL001348 [Lentilactobacillus farraginis DSM 18382 = JCM 14108]GAF36100.1 hypothetical protein JCM14108_1044 [Lentilactobacillus farraginis DSM 18382 = JCM 14108]